MIEVVGGAMFIWRDEDTRQSSDCSSECCNCKPYKGPKENSKEQENECKKD